MSDDRAEVSDAGDLFGKHHIYLTSENWLPLHV